MQPLNSGAIGKVFASGNSKFKQGDVVSGALDWASYTCVPEGKGLTKIDASAGVPLSYYLGVLGKNPCACIITCIWPYGDLHHTTRQACCTIPCWLLISIACSSIKILVLSDVQQQVLMHGVDVLGVAIGLGAAAPPSACQH